MLCCVLELGTGFVDTFSQFLACRALFGVAMGGIWGLSSSSALENLPIEIRGLASGILQEGYIVGYIFAAVINLTLVAQYGWRALFWTGAGITCFAAVIRALIPESPFFLRVKEQEKAKGTNTSRNFLRQTKEMLRLHWLLCIYAVLLMTGLTFFLLPNNEHTNTSLQGSISCLMVHRHVHTVYEHALDNVMSV
jgi:SHS family lactate transporter-like MFS transporter